MGTAIVRLETVAVVESAQYGINLIWTKLESTAWIPASGLCSDGEPAVRYPIRLMAPLFWKA